MSRLRAACALLTIAIAASCDMGGPENADFPSPGQLVAGPRAVGVPYGSWVVFEVADRRIALQMSPIGRLGEQIRYQWVASDDDGRFAGADLDAGEGRAVERRGIGRVNIPGLSLRWSRGSGSWGWIYWPEGGHELSAYSRPWTDLAEIDPAVGRGKWLHSKKHRE